MKDGLLDLLQRALNIWGEGLDEVWQLLTTSPQSFKGGAVWGVIVNINAAVQGIAYGLLVLFFAAGVLHQTISFQELRRPEMALKMFLRFAIAKGLISHCMEILLAIMQISQGILQQVIFAGGGNLSMSLTVPGEIVSAIDGIGLFASVSMMGLVLIGSIIATVLAFILVMTVYGRFLKLYMLTALAPIPLSSFAGDHISQVGRSFLKNYASACIEFAVVALSCVIVSSLISSAPVINTGDAPLAQVFSYLAEVLFNMLLLVGTVRMCDRIAQTFIGM